MESMEYEECSKAVTRVVPKMKNAHTEINELIKEIPVLSDVQKEFYRALIKCRYDKVFIPLYKKIIEEKRCG